MIEGIVVRMETDELMTHLLKRVEYHTQRSKFYEQECEKFKAEADDAKIRQGQNTFVQTSKAMEEAAEKHDRSALWFNFVADHLIPDETYHLDDKALEVIEAVPPHQYW